MKNIITLCTIGLFICSPSVHALSLSYGHYYEDLSKKNVDVIGLEHTFKNRITLATEWKATPDNQDNGHPGTAFSHEKFYEKKFKAKYKYSFNNYYSAGPELEYANKTDGDKYKAKITNDFNLTNTDKVYVKMVGERMNYDAKKPSKKILYAESGYTKKIDKTKITYEYTYYHGQDTKLFNNKNTDYRHKFNMEYKLSSKISPYIEVRNESLSSKSDRRQTIFETGLSYTFF